MFLIKIALLTVYVVSFVSSAQAKVAIKTVRDLYASYLAENRVLFYIGRHLHTDRVVIWGQTALSEDMVKIRLENNSFNMGPMEALLRSTGNRWRGNYKNYQLYYFDISEPGQTDKIFTDAVRGSQQLQLLGGYVDRVEEVDDGERFLDAKGEAVLPVVKITNGGITECAVAAGSACSLLIESLKDFDKLGLTEIEKQIRSYFEEYREALEGNGIVIGEMAEALGISSISLGHTRSRLKKKLGEEHFIQRIGSKPRSGDSKYAYRFADAVDVVVLTPAEERILAYFAKHMEALQGNGIVIGEMAEALGIKSGGSLVNHIKSLKNKLDEEHFIQRIGDSKHVYRFADAVDGDTSKEEQILAYFEEHMEALEGNGIVIGEMAKALEIERGQSLGLKITILKEKLDEEHFIQRIGSEERSGDRKYVYRFADAVVVFSSAEELILAYFEEYREALEGNGIVIGEMAETLGIKSGESLGQIRTNLKKKFDEGHFIQRIGSEERSGDRRKVYRFADAVVVFTPEEELILAYFEEYREALEGNGIVVGEMAKALGIKSRSLGRKIRSLKEKLDKGHFIQRIVGEPRSVDSKYAYRFADVDVLTTEELEKLILAYFAAHMEALEGNGIVLGEMAKALKIESGESLGQKISILKKKLDEEHVIQRIGSELRHVDGNQISFYRFADVDVLTTEEKKERVLAYFEVKAHMEALQGNGIVIGEMAEALGIKSGGSLGKIITSLKEKLDEGHFIHRIGSEPRSVDGKTITFYRFADTIDVLTPEEDRVVNYFAAHMEALGGNGIVAGEMAKALEMSSGSLGRKISILKKKLDEEHFIQQIGSKPRSGDSKYAYRFADAVDVVVLTPAEERILAYFAKHMEALQGNGIVIGEMAEALGIKSGGSLGKIITSLKEKLDEGHFIHRIGSEPRSVDGKTITFYRFADTIDVLTPEEDRVVNYFAAHMEALGGNGIVAGEMAKALEMSSGSLGRKISILKKKLDEEHFIQQIGSKPRSGDSKYAYRFADAVDVVVLTPAEERILAYFAKHMEALQGNGIVIGEMAEAFGMSSRSLGQTRSSLKNKLDEEHFIQRIGREPRSGKHVYRFADVDVLTTEEKKERVLAYFEVKAHMEALQGNGIVIGEMAEALGIKSGGSLGKIITSLKEKLDEGHFIHRIGSELRHVDGKTITFYRFADAVDVEQLQIDLQGGR